MLASNNAEIFKTQHSITHDGLDIRFVVNTIAPYRLTKQLEGLIGSTGRVVNLSSAAQAPVNLDALGGAAHLTAMDAYAQSKLAITMRTRVMAESPDAPIMIAINPSTMLGSKMVKEGFGVDGEDLSVGVDILCRAALSKEFESASGHYFDNDKGKFTSRHTQTHSMQLS